MLTVDPGAFTGWAVFGGSELVRCGCVTPNNWAYLAEVVIPSWKIVDALIEEPTIYPHSKASPVSIMALQLKVGELKGRFESVGCRVELVQPRTWKRQAPKQIHNARTFGTLTFEERVLVQGVRHDVLDAVGLGLWKLGRMK